MPFSQRRKVISNSLSSGLSLEKLKVAEILENNPENIVVIDEAYADFSSESCAVLLEKYPNLIIVGTFSKSRGMAGARLGYLIASEELVADVEKVKYSINPYNVNSVTQAIGAAVLSENEYFEDKVKEIVETSSMLSIREKSDIICLIECYKNVDNLSKLCMEKIVESVTRLEKLRDFIRQEGDYIPGSAQIVADLNSIINDLKKGLL